MSKTVYKIGADPELFIQNKKDGSFISAHHLVPGNKIRPHIVEFGAIQVDGLAAEFNIRPAVTAAAFKDNIRAVLIDLDAIIQRNVKVKGSPANDVTLKVQPTVTFDQGYFDSIEMEHKQLGCIPDWNTWTQSMNEPANGNLPVRTGGGHIHIGWTANIEEYEDGHFFDCQEATKQLDASLFLASLLWDNDSERRKMYGRVGSFRPKSYGVEYRPLSNAWVADPDLHEYVFNTARHAVEILDDDDEKLWEDSWAKDLIKKARANHPILRSELIPFADHLVNFYDFDAVPDKYMHLGAYGEEV